MLTHEEITTLLKHVNQSSERKIAETIGISSCTLQRAVPLPVTPESEVKIRAYLANHLVEPKNKALEKIEAQKQLLLLRNELRRQRDAERQAQKEADRARREAERQAQKEANRAQREAERARREADRKAREEKKRRLKYDM